ncbi:NTP transferase domain-containing protein [Mucilaginibacter agri]|uniref:Probable molybdenum cofactor guanylyltransferase n=1 Tax=Mucilaginibacter agri TaxID=2695265 RepID=A0A966DTW8_9SPHI|nr:NTP transferase domain-containing protein [Mucilaginibacter agri]NCD71095.1 NTP transferase domain-containing protein [Mucilaginibacter agri]
MTTAEDKLHRKHAALARPDMGDFGRNELGILGAPCGVIRNCTSRWLKLLGSKWKIAYVDADHQDGRTSDDTMDGCALEFTDKISYKRVDFKADTNTFTNRALFNDQDLVLINSNHFKARKQIVIIHPDKPLNQKLEKLTDVALILVSDDYEVPDFIRNYLPNINSIPVLNLNDEARIMAFLEIFLSENVTPVNGLILAGGKSTRMQGDKGSIAYHGKTQRAYMYDMLSELCGKVYLSDNVETVYDTIEDTFIGLGPLGGILSAMQTDPNVAWLTVACDLPYLTIETLNLLIKRRNPSKLATAFWDSEGKFPEPLITIWEPRAYAVMLQFLAQGYSCPRKILINTDVELLTAPNVSEFRNINTPEERDEALRFFRKENHSF